ncbi:MAG: hypothetical protein ACRDQB_06455 [Thermocrispum sp.]
MRQNATSARNVKCLPGAPTGFTRRQVLDVLAGVAMKTLSNYANHLAHTPLDDAFAAQAWTS